jgi:hypothetical protein
VKLDTKFLSFKKVNKWLKFFAIIPILVVAFYFSFRNILLHNIIDKKTANYRIKKNVSLSFSNINFNGISGIIAQNLIVAPIGTDTLLKAQNIYLHIRLLPLLVGNIRVDVLKIENVNINIIKKDSTNNYSFIFNKNKVADSVTVQQNNINIAETADHLLDNVFDNIPNTINISNTKVIASIDSAKVEWHIPNFALNNGSLSSTARITESKTVVDWNMTATINKSLSVLAFFNE